MKKSPTFSYNLPYENHEKKSSYEVEVITIYSMASKVGQYFTWKGFISKEYLTVRGHQPEDSHRLIVYEEINPFQVKYCPTLLAIEYVVIIHVMQYIYVISRT